MPSEASRRVVAELWKRPANTTLTLGEWRHAASAAARMPRPPGLRTEAVDADGVPCVWAWLDGRDRTDGPVVVVLHGGGFVVCSAATHLLLGAHLAAAAGGRALVVDYRLAPEHPFPAAVEDCAAAYRWLLGRGRAAAGIALFGESAGGNLCLTTALSAGAAGLEQPAALVLASPAPDLTYQAESYLTKAAVDPFSRIDNRARTLEYYLRGGDPTDPMASPIFADLTGLAPTLCLVGPDETKVDDCVALASRAAAYGVDFTLEVVEGAFHTWLAYADTVPEAADSIERIGRFVAARAASPV